MGKFFIIPSVVNLKEISNLKNANSAL